jgi:hypothetical protein
MVSLSGTCILFLSLPCASLLWPITTWLISLSKLINLNQSFGGTIPLIPKPAFITHLSQLHKLSPPLPISTGSTSIQSSHPQAPSGYVAEWFPTTVTLFLVFAQHNYCQAHYSLLAVNVLAVLGGICKSQGQYPRSLLWDLEVSSILIIGEGPSYRIMGPARRHLPMPLCHI